MFLLFNCLYAAEFVDGKPVSALLGWQDIIIEPVELEKLGFIIEYDRLPEHLDGNAKNEICVSNPVNLKFDNVQYVYSTSLLISDEISINIGDFPFDQLPRIIIDISDKLLLNARLLICYQKNKLDSNFGYRYSLSLVDIIGYGKEKQKNNK